jgi:hypothetical protein
MASDPGGVENGFLNIISCCFIAAYLIFAGELSTYVDVSLNRCGLGFGGLRFFYPQVIHTVDNLSFLVC